MFTFTIKSPEVCSLILLQLTKLHFFSFLKLDIWMDNGKLHVSHVVIAWEQENIAVISQMRK